MKNIIKNAGMVEGFVKSIADKIGVDKPFETIFSTMGVATAFSFSKIFGLLLAAAEVSGFGPGEIGKYIDELLGFKSGNPNLSDNSLKDTAKNVVNSVLNAIGFKSKAMLKDILLVKGYVEFNDIISASMCSHYVIKTAKKPGQLGLFKGFLGRMKGGTRLSLFNIIYGLLRKFVSGLLLIGVAGGIKESLKELYNKPSVEKEEETGSSDFYKLPVPKTNQIGGEKKYYQNIQNDVMNTIINFLDKQYIFKDSNNKDINFSEKFKERFGISIENSPQMDKLLESIESINGGAKIGYIGSWKSFIAPNIETIADFFLPGIET